MQLISQFSKQAEQNPRAQQEMRALAKGEMPEEMPI
jgi:hypothetical protein